MYNFETNFLQEQTHIIPVTSNYSLHFASYNYSLFLEGTPVSRRGILPSLYLVYNTK